MIYIQSGRRLHLWALSRPVPSLTFWSCFLPAGGLPRTLTTDNGPQLVSAEFTSYIQSKGIKHIRTAYYHPQSNGGVERFNQSCKARLDRPNDGSRSAGEGLLRITVFPFSRHNKIKWNTFSYIFYLVISSDSINEKVLMISVHH